MKQKLEQVRKTIDEIDDQIMDLILKRIDLVRKIGEIKESFNQEVADPGREAQIIGRLKTRVANQLSVEQIRQVFDPIFTLSKKVQKER
jgi:monofunctional chorismate mutase